MPSRMLRVLLTGLVAASTLLAPSVRSGDYTPHSSVGYQSPPHAPGFSLGYRAAHADGPNDWPMFGHDLAHTGYNPDETSLKPPLRLKWSYNIGGVVDSSPAVTADLVYVGSWDDWKVYALDAASGALRWSYTTGGGLGSPALAAGVVYVCSNDGKVYALDAATGALRWSYSGCSIYSSPAVANGVLYQGGGGGLVALDAATGAFKWRYWWGGNSYSSPAVADGVVYMGSDARKVYALDAASGALRWSYTTGREVRSSPAVAERVVYVGSDDNQVYALDAGSGALKWSYQTAGKVRSPAVADGVVYVGSVDEAWKVYALDAATGTHLWSYRIGGAAETSPAVANGVVYQGSGTNLFALDAATGTHLWSYRIGDAARSSPAVANGMIYVGSSSEPNIYAFEAQPPPATVQTLPYASPLSFPISWTVPITWTGTAAGSYDVQYRDGPSGAWTDLITSTTALTTTFGGQDGHTYYFRARAYTTTGAIGDWSEPVSTTVFLVPPVHAYPSDWPMFRYDPARTGYGGGGAPVPPLRLKWSYQTGGAVQSSAAVVNGLVYVGSDDGKVYALEAATGALRWSKTTGGYVFSSPAVANGVVYVGSYDGNLYALDATTGALRCSFKSQQGQWFPSSPAVTGGSVYVGTNDGAYALYAPEGEAWWYGCLDVMWRYSTASPVRSPPAVVNGTLYVGSDEGKVYALDAQTGTLRWNYDTGTRRAVYSTAVGSGVVHVGLVNGYVYALDAQTGALKWTYQSGGGALLLAVADGVVHVVDINDGRGYALDAATGALKWSYEAGVRFYSSPAVANGAVYVGSRDAVDGGKVYALDAATGAVRWSYTTGSYVSSSPAVADGMVYVGSVDRKLYAFETQPAPARVQPLAPFQSAATFPISWTVPVTWTGVAAASYDVQYRDGASGAWTDLITSTTALSTTFSGQDGHTYYFRARSRTVTGVLGDYADGDGDTHTTVDLTPPAGSLSINNGVTYATSITATLNLTATDQISGVGDVSFSNDGSAWSSWDTYAATKTWLLASGDGPKTVYGRFRDLAGNVSPVYSDTILLDTTPPATPAPDDDVAGVSSQPSLTFAWPAAGDNLSGVDAYYWKTDCTPVTATTVLTATTSVLPDGQHTFYVRARDGAGNYSAYGKHAFTIRATTLDPLVLNGPDSPTDREKVNVNGAAGAGATVRLYLNCAYYGQTTSGSDGIWQFQDVPLALGENVIMASVADVGGGLSPISLPVVVVRREGQSPPPAPAVARLLGSVGGTLSSGNFALEIPEGALGGQTQVVMTPDSEVWPPCVSPAICKRFVGSFASITALERDSAAPAQLLKAVRVSLPYDPQALGFIRPESLVMYYYDPEAGTWVGLASQVDTANRRVTAEVSHLTRFALLGGMGTWVVFVPALMKGYAGW